MHLGLTSLVIDKRSHIGGNCYDYMDEHGIRQDTITNRIRYHIHHKHHHHHHCYDHHHQKHQHYYHHHEHHHHRMIPVVMMVLKTHTVCGRLEDEFKAEK
jgi:hypothetical protein